MVYIFIIIQLFLISCTGSVVEQDSRKVNEDKAGEQGQNSDATASADATEKTTKKNGTENSSTGDASDESDDAGNDTESDGDKSGNGDGPGGNGGSEDQNVETYVFVANKDQFRIDVFQIDPEANTLEKIDGFNLVLENKPATIIVKGKYAYISADDPSGVSHSVVAAKIDFENSQLIEVNKISGMNRSLYFSINNSGNKLYSADYFDSQVSIYDLNEVDGSIVSRLYNADFPRHPHSIVLSPDESHFFVPAKSSNRIYTSALQGQSINELSRFNLSSLASMAYVPRHLRIHKQSGKIYVSNEAHVSVSMYESNAGVLSHLQTESANPGNENNLTTSEIRIHPNGKYVYVAVRDEDQNGRDAIVSNSLNAETGTMAFLQKIATQSFPRSFDISENGKYLIVAGEKNNTMELFSIDGNTGLLSSQSATTEGLETPYAIEAVDVILP